MPLAVIAQLCAFSLLLTGGQVLFKLAAKSVPPITSFQNLFALLFSPWFWSAIFLYGSATLLWIFILQKTPLSLAYPFVALGFVVIPFVSWLFFRETLTLTYGTGTLMILGGLALIAHSAS
jgi:drug/metabolite transporter (DMT)-like permease